VSIESDDDLEGLRRAGRVAALTLSAMREHVAPGVSTAELDDIAACLLHAEGARSAPRLVYDFPGTTCISVNDEIVHGIPGSRRLVAGDIVTLDVTIELGGYYADTALTVPVPPASGSAILLIEAAEAAFHRALGVTRAGAALSAVGAAVEDEVNRRGFRVFRELCGHGIGRTIHEDPEVLNYRHPGVHRRLNEGLVITIEPLVSAGSSRIRTDPDGWTVRSRDGALASHHEHTLVVRNGEPEILTRAA
jgi:methionyl aminopeptidase